MNSSVSADASWDLWLFFFKFVSVCSIMPICVYVLLSSRLDASFEFCHMSNASRLFAGSFPLSTALIQAAASEPSNGVAQSDGRKTLFRSKA